MYAFSEKLVEEFQAYMKKMHNKECTDEEANEALRDFSELFFAAGYSQQENK